MEKTEQIVKWIVQNVTIRDVPADEGNVDALIYNLVRLAREGRQHRRYNYELGQDEEIAELYRQFGR